MKLSEILERSNCPRPNWDAYVRRDQIPFMRRDTGSSRDPFSEVHLVAFRAFLLLRKMGLEAAIAGEAVNASFGALTSMLTANDAVAAPAVGVRLVADPVSGDAVFDYLGWGNAEFCDLPELGRIAVDARQLMGVAPSNRSEAA